MTFELALAAMKMGDNVRRAEWEKGKYITLTKLNIYNVHEKNRWIGMFDGKTLVYWVALQKDMLAEDWTVVEPWTS